MKKDAEQGPWDLESSASPWFHVLMLMEIKPAQPRGQWRRLLWAGGTFCGLGCLEGWGHGYARHSKGMLCHRDWVQRKPWSTPPNTFPINRKGPKPWQQCSDFAPSDSFGDFWGNSKFSPQILLSRPCLCCCLLVGVWRGMARKQDSLRKGKSGHLGRREAQSPWPLLIWLAFSSREHP